MDQSGLSAMDHAAKDDLIRFLLAENAELKSRITALEVRLAKDSHNSSKPPSSDGLRKPAPKSLRQVGQRPKGGQKGHKGSALERVAEPDHVISHLLPATCDACGSTLDEAHISEARQVFDIPPQQVEVTEHRVLEARCTCGKVHRSNFPEGVTPPRNMVHGYKPPSSISPSTTCCRSCAPPESCAIPVVLPCRRVPWSE